MSETGKRTETLRTIVTEEEYERVFDAAAAQERSLSNWLRIAALEKLKRDEMARRKH